jgi:hypothetical protein
VVADQFGTSRAAVRLAGLLGGLALAVPALAGEGTDPLDRLVDAVVRFRGLGDPSVESYRVEMRLVDEVEESPPLLEVWRVPESLALRAARPGTPRAIVRSLALYLEPLYVARSSFLRTDLAGSARSLREVASISLEPEPDGSRIRIELPPDGDARLPGALRDVIRLEAGLDSEDRIATLTIDLREAGIDGGPGTLSLACEPSPDPRDAQPARATWTLPDGRVVDIRTTFRDEGGRRVPAGRRISFPSRYAPGESETISVEYGPYEIDVLLTDEVFSDRGAFRFDANGLVDE